MYGHTLSFLAGIWLVTTFSALPESALSASLIAGSVLLLIILPKGYCAWVSYPLAFIFGLGWSSYHGTQLVSEILPQTLEGKTLHVTGTIRSIPVIKPHTTLFTYQIESINSKPQRPVLAQLSYYHNKQVPKFKIGDRWQLAIRLKHPRGFWNPGSFDYAGWLFQHGVRATGYVVPQIEPCFLEQKWQVIDQFRVYVSEIIAHHLADRPLAGLINALVTGLREDTTEQQWWVMRHTGTNHLFAIAGLHVGLIAGMFYRAIDWLWRRFSQLTLYCPASQVAKVGALVAAVFYSAVAGFSLPTQRAIIMLGIFFITQLLRRNLSPWHSLCITIWLILLREPFAVLSESFWLSFGAVACLILGTSGCSAPLKKGWQLGKIQAAISLGLMPMSLLFFQQVSWVGIFTNLIAIPWVSILILPLSLLGALLGLVGAKLSAFLLVLAEKLLEILWGLLSAVASVPHFQFYTTVTHYWGLWTSSLSTGLLLTPLGTPGRFVGLLGLLPLLLKAPAYPKEGEIWFTLLDVGQGLATVLRTQNHVLLYDVGPKWHGSLDAGQAVIGPFLRHIGVRKIDRVMISHSDNDHSGGLHSLLKQFSPQKILTSTPEHFPEISTELCRRHQQWNWDGVHFQLLYPLDGYYGLGNNSSCVLSVDNGAYRILLAGDIEKLGEKALLNLEKDLKTTVLIAPHHGSKTSSTAAWISATAPRYVLFSTGYRNRFGFPHPTVLARYQNYPAVHYNTAYDGAVFIKLSQEQLTVKTYRETQRRFWQI